MTLNRKETITCQVCGKPHTVQFDVFDFYDWRYGAKNIQDAMPYLTASERELFISGVCGDCFHKMFGDEDDDE